MKLSYESIVAQHRRGFKAVDLEELPLAKKVAGDDDDGEESPAYKGKYLDEFLAIAGILADVDTVVDDGSQGSD